MTDPRKLLADEARRESELVTPLYAEIARLQGELGTTRIQLSNFKDELRRTDNKKERLEKALVEIRDKPVTRQSLTAMVMQDIAHTALEGAQ